jgi:isopentenyl-diphosphate delta-isomerase
LEQVEAELRGVMLLAGARDVATLRKAPAVLGPGLRRWLKLAKPRGKG